MLRGDEAAICTLAASVNIRYSLAVNQIEFNRAHAQLDLFQVYPASKLPYQLNRTDIRP